MSLLFSLLSTIVTKNHHKYHVITFVRTDETSNFDNKMGHSILFHRRPDHDHMEEETKRFASKQGALFQEAHITHFAAMVMPKSFFVVKNIKFNIT